jgi:predicted helicase
MHNVPSNLVNVITNSIFDKYVGRKGNSGENPMSNAMMRNIQSLSAKGFQILMEED